MSNSKGQGYELSDGYNYLMLKAEQGNYEEVRTILTDLQEIDINATNRNGSTALSLACRNGHYKIVQVLVASGADTNIKNHSGQSPLFLACWNNYRDIVKVLLDHDAEINTKDQRGWTPLMIAAYNSHKEIVKLLVDRDADILIKDCFDKTALDRTKDPQIIKLLQDKIQNTQKHNSNNDHQKDETPPGAQNPQQTPAGELLHSILKKPTPKKDGEHSRYNDEDPVRVQDFGSQQNWTTASSVYPSHRYQEHGSHAQKSAEKFATSPGKRDLITSQSETKFGRGYASLDSRKNSESKILPSRPSRPRNERNNSIDRGHQLSSRSPTRSTILSTRNKTSPIRSRLGELTSPLSEAKRQTLKEDLQSDLTSQVGSVSEKIKDIVSQKIALEVPQHMQAFEQNIGKELNSAFQFRMDSIFKSLHSSFNLKVKFCLNKLGFNTGGLDLAPFSDDDLPYTSSQKPFKAEVPRYNYDKESKAIEKEISRLEKSVSAKSFVSMDRSVHSDSHGDKHHHDCVHTSFAARTQIKNELSEQLGQEVRATTEYLMEFSNGKLNEIVRNETGQVHQKMLGELHRNMDIIEEDFRKKFEDFINKKVNELAAALTGSSHQQLVSGKKPSPEATPSKQLFSASKGSEKKITFGQDVERTINHEKQASTSDFSKSILKSPESNYVAKFSTSAQKDKELTQARGKIEKLKNSLNFIDDGPGSLGERSEDSFRDNRRELHYHQLEAGDSLRDSYQSTKIKSLLGTERNEPRDTLKKEYSENIQAAAKIDEIRNFYQNKYGANRKLE